MSKLTIVALVVLSQVLIRGDAQEAQQASTEPMVAIRAGALIDVASGAVIQPAVVVVNGSRIAAQGADLRPPRGARVIDVPDLTLIPGLIDTHTHLLDERNGAATDGSSAMLLSVARGDTAKRALRGAALAREMLESGFTTVRDLGNSGMNGDVALRDAIEAGWVTGPRIIASTRAIAPTGGQFGTLTPAAQALITEEYVPVTGVDAARAAVRQAIYDGADCIKVIVNAGARMLSTEEVTAIATEAHRLGRTVAAHATTESAARIAAEAGVDSIEHGYRLPDDVLAVMAKKGIFLVPTDPPADVYMRMNNDLPRLTAAERGTLQTAYDGAVRATHDRLMRAVRAGVRIATGADIYLIVPGQTRGEASLSVLRSYLDAGLSPLAVLRAATLNAAELLGRRDDLGELAPGKLADIVGVRGEPLRDGTALTRPSFVMKGGVIVRNDVRR
jgi:imidazolonepropionase-like amidohydrolase